MLVLILNSFGLAFFGTPHHGGNDALLRMGKTAIAIVKGIFRHPPNDLIEALCSGSLFADVLQAHWRNQLSLYKIVSFYETEDQHHVGDQHNLHQLLTSLRLAGPHRAKRLCYNWSPWRYREPSWS